MFDLDRIAAESGVASVQYQAEVGSTNDWALQLAADDERSWPLLVLASKQTGGRGRGLNRWWAADGALTFSMVIDTVHWRIAIESWPQIALVTGVAICEALQQLFPAACFGLKWPNDVFLNGRKVCGILVESGSSKRVVVGVGVNVNNSFHQAPELQVKATSLSDAAGQSFELTETLIAVVSKILERVQAMSKGYNFATEFRRFCLLTGHHIQIDQSQRNIVGLCEGIDDAGALLVRGTCGVQRVVSGTVAQVWH